ncbi:pollen-specific leucine-rich repeat extensin-like protein 1 isoform X2 [Ananas comosus]|uniref:Pollen-specific leucine-rich repeat extensin-like protein 1 isoform X2 n=1 Tax=Ananas comosus TaxID=4615 RepID=A0A6P5FR74_ANACO|nr:pollen-specific leucine-rich repeat extensin-like protein 1 isoform X2 [Ananas comosus]
MAPKSHFAAIFALFHPLAILFLPRALAGNNHLNNTDPKRPKQGEPNGHQNDCTATPTKGPDHERQSHRGRRAVRTSSPPPDNAPGCGLAKYDSNPPQEQQRGVTTASNKKEPPVKGRASDPKRPKQGEPNGHQNHRTAPPTQGHGRPAVPTSCPKDNTSGYAPAKRQRDPPAVAPMKGATNPENKKNNNDKTPVKSKPKDKDKKKSCDQEVVGKAA